MVAGRKSAWEFYEKASKVIATNGGTDLYKRRE
jgi:hypothetical protein